MERLFVLILLAAALVTATLLQGCSLFGLGGAPQSTPAPTAAPGTAKKKTTTQTTTTLSPKPQPPQIPRSGQFCHQSQGPRTLSRIVDDNNRTYIVYVPEHLKEKAPLWLVMPGAYDTADWMMNYIGLQKFATKHGIAFIVFQGSDFGWGVKFNVGLGSQPVMRGPSKGPYDINFVKSVLADAMPCIDLERIHCAGWSNGGRFCSLLASKMSEKIASIGMISSLRFPKPNHAKRAMPVLAFHGTKDPVNPWLGHGDPTYWNESVLDAFDAWVNFNGCKKNVPIKWKHFHGKAYRTEPQHGCRNGAIVQLVKLEGFGHPWPHSKCRIGEFKNPSLGPCSMDVEANDLLLDFFRKHPLSWASEESLEAAAPGDSAALNHKDNQTGIPTEKWSSKFPRPSSSHFSVLLVVLSGSCLLAAAASTMISRFGRRRLHDSCDDARARKPLDREASEAAALLNGL